MALRRLTVVSLVALFGLAAGPALAQQAWPAMPLAATGSRGPGGYLSCLKSAAYWLGCLAGVRTTAWAPTDSYQHK